MFITPIAESFASVASRNLQIALCAATVALCTLVDPSLADAEPLHGAIMRFEFDGQPDVTFSGDGFVEANLPGEGSELFRAGARTTATTANDRYIVASSRKVRADSRLLLARFRSDKGALDTPWGTGGFVTDTIAGTFSERVIDRISVDSSGRIIAVGELIGSTRSSIFITRFNANGAFDPTFGTSGRTIFNVSATSNDAVANMGFAIDANGRFIVGGYSSDGGPTRSLLVRFASNGLLDTTFGTGGRALTTLPGTTSSFVRDVVLDLNGRIVVTGAALTSASSTTVRGMMARFSASGVLDANFNTNGVRIVTFPIGRGARSAPPSWST